MLPESSTGLYWSIRGTVLCRAHAAELDSARWNAERWTPLPTTSQGARGFWYQCQRCAPTGAAFIYSAPSEEEAS